MSKHKKTKFNPNLILPIAAGGCLLIAVVLSIVLIVISSNEADRERERQAIIMSTEIPEGVVINDIAVGGLNYDEAVEKLEEAEKALADDIKFELVYEDKSFDITSDDFVLEYNTEEVVDKALGMIKGGGYLALKNYMNTISSEGVNYELTYTVDAAKFNERLDEICEEVNVAPENARAELKDGVRINYNNVVKNSPFEYVSDKDGLEVDREKLLELLLERVGAREFGELEIPTNVVEADITLAEVKKNTTLRAYFGTSYSAGNGSNRVHNILTAANFLNGTRVKPGETFSMEATIGRRVDPEIWREAPAVISGGAATENQLGGGVCQVSTTLYNAIVKADLEIVFRKNHSKASSYVDPGLDATINTDTIDFKWKNNTDYDVYVLSWLDTSREDVYCAVYGARFPKEFDRIDFKSSLKKRVEPTKTEYITKSSFDDGEWMLVNEAITGYIYESYAYYYDGNELVDTKFVAESNYKMHPKRYYVYKGYKAGAALDPYKEMIQDENGKFVRKYPNQPTPTPSPAQPTDPVGETTNPQEPTPTQQP